VINRQALEDNNAVLEIQQGACRCRYLAAGVTYTPFGGVTSWFGMVKLMIGK